MGPDSEGLWYMRTMIPYRFAQPLLQRLSAPKKEQYQCGRASEANGTKGAKSGVDRHISSRPYSSYLVGDGLAKLAIEI